MRLAPFFLFCVFFLFSLVSADLGRLSFPGKPSIPFGSSEQVVYSTFGPVDHIKVPVNFRAGSEGVQKIAFRIVPKGELFHEERSNEDFDGNMELNSAGAVIQFSAVAKSSYFFGQDPLARTFDVIRPFNGPLNLPTISCNQIEGCDILAEAISSRQTQNIVRTVAPRFEADLASASDSLRTSERRQRKTVQVNVVVDA